MSGWISFGSRVVYRLTSSAAWAGGAKAAAARARALASGSRRVRGFDMKTPEGQVDEGSVPGRACRSSDPEYYKMKDSGF